MMDEVMEKSKAAWLGEYPTHWDVKRIKNIFQEVESRSTTGTEDLLSVSHYTGVTRRKDNLESDDEHVTSAKTLVGYKKVTAGDLVSNIMLAWQGSYGISPYDGITSPAYCVYRCKPEYNPEYFGYLFSTNAFKAEFRRRSTGIIDSRLRLYTDKFFSIYSLVPPRHEQDEIVGRIKLQSEKVNRFIHKKERLINVLKEQKQCIIDDNLKTSGENWKWVRLKNIATINDEALSEQTDKTFVLRYIDIGNVDSDGRIAELQEFTFKNAPSRARRIVKRGDVIVSTVRTYLRAISLIEFDDNNLIASTGFAVLRPKSIVTADFLNLLLRGSYFIDAVSQNSYGVSYPAIKASTLSSLRVCLPHSINDQNQIISKVKAETRSLDKAINEAEKEIALIQEYKQSMITEAVFGKKSD